MITKCQLIVLLFICTGLTTNISAQKAESYETDSLGRRQGLCTFPNGFSFVKNEKVIKGYEVWEQGTYVNDLKEGLWNLWINNWQLIGTRLYVHGDVAKEYHLKNGKLITELFYKKNENSSTSELYISRIITYKKGKIISDNTFELKRL